MGVGSLCQGTRALTALKNQITSRCRKGGFMAAEENHTIELHKFEQKPASTDREELEQTSDEADKGRPAIWESAWTYRVPGQEASFLGKHATMLRHCRMRRPPRLSSHRSYHSFLHPAVATASGCECSERSGVGSQTRRTCVANERTT